MHTCHLNGIFEIISRITFLPFSSLVSSILSTKLNSIPKRNYHYFGNLVACSYTPSHSSRHLPKLKAGFSFWNLNTSPHHCNCVDSYILHILYLDVFFAFYFFVISWVFICSTSPIHAFCPILPQVFYFLLTAYKSIFMVLDFWPLYLNPCMLFFFYPLLSIAPDYFRKKENLIPSLIFAYIRPIFVP